VLIETNILSYSFCYPNSLYPYHILRQKVISSRGNVKIFVENSKVRCRTGCAYCMEHIVGFNYIFSKFYRFTVYFSNGTFYYVGKIEFSLI
jgi:hypothetical protein